MPARPSKTNARAGSSSSTSVSTRESELRQMFRTLNIVEICRLTVQFNQKLYAYVSRIVRIVSSEDGGVYALLMDSSCCDVRTLGLCYLIQFWGCDLKMPLPPQASSADVLRDELRELADRLWAEMGFPVERGPIMAQIVTPVDGGNSLNPDFTSIYLIGGMMERTNVWLDKVKVSVSR